MGCDIHAGIEYRDDDQWHALMVPNPYFGECEGEPQLTAQLDINRNYILFAILADVRNGYNGHWEPIAANRGLPKDISTEARETACTGDHSDTWVSLREILDYDWDVDPFVADQMRSVILPPMLELAAKYGPENVRLVMNFDS